MSKTKQLHQQMQEATKALQLPTIRSTYREVADQARAEALTYEQYLYGLLDSEAYHRHQRRIERYRRESGLPTEKTMTVFERDRLPEAVNGQLSMLLDGEFLDRKENILAFGNPGSGKTHLLCGIGHAMIDRGRRILFRPCSLLVQELLVAKRELELPKILKRLARYDAIIIDDIGYVQHSREEMEVLFTLLAERYERGSVMLTSNLPFSQWENIFKDPMTTAAAIDRLVHHCIILELNLTSYRLEATQQKTSKKIGKKTVEANGE